MNVFPSFKGINSDPFNRKKIPLKSNSPLKINTNVQSKIKNFENISSSVTNITEIDKKKRNSIASPEFISSPQQRFTPTKQVEKIFNNKKPINPTNVNKDTIQPKKIGENESNTNGENTIFKFDGASEKPNTSGGEMTIFEEKKENNVENKEKTHNTVEKNLDNENNENKTEEIPQQENIEETNVEQKEENNSVEFLSPEKTSEETNDVGQQGKREESTFTLQEESNKENDTKKEQNIISPGRNVPFVKMEMILPVSPNQSEEDLSTTENREEHLEEKGDVGEKISLDLGRISNKLFDNEGSEKKISLDLGRISNKLFDNQEGKNMALDFSRISNQLSPSENTSEDDIQDEGRALTKEPPRFYHRRKTLSMRDSI